MDRKIATLIVMMLISVHAQAQIIPERGVAEITDAEAAYLKTWIPVNCCVTNRCCFPVSKMALLPLGKDMYQVAATGQKIARTQWSPDGITWRCACDRINGEWVVHKNANTRCIFPVLSVTQGVR